MSDHVGRIERIEKQIETFALKKESKKEIDTLRAELKKLYEGNHMELLELKAHVWGIGQEVSGRSMTFREEDK